MLLEVAEFVRSCTDGGRLFQAVGLQKLKNRSVNLCQICSCWWQWLPWGRDLTSQHIMLRCQITLRTSVYTCHAVH